MLKAVHIKDKYFVILILILLGLSAIETMQGLANLEVVKHSRSSFIYAIIGILATIYILFHWAIVFNGSVYIKSICLFFIYMLVRYTFFYDDASIMRLIANCTWPIIAILGYAIGYKNYTSHNLSNIARIQLALTVPFLIYNVFKSFTLTYNSEEFAKDAFFVCLIFLPYIFLLRSPKSKYLLYFIFLIIGVISLKRSIIIVTLLAGLLFFYNANKHKILLTLIITAAIVLSLSFFGENLIGQVSDRFMSIREDGGSGRDVLYAMIWNDISYFSTQEILVGKGINSVSDIAGMDAHMDILQILHSIGLIGLAIYMVMYMSIVHKLFIYRNISWKKDHLGLITFITFICFVVIANMNCFIFNPPFITPMLFIMSLQVGAISYRIKYSKKINIY